MQYYPRTLIAVDLITVWYKAPCIICTLYIEVCKVEILADRLCVTLFKPFLAFSTMVGFIYTFSISFCQFLNSGCSLFIIYKWLVQNFRRISTLFQKNFKICLFEKDCSFYTNSFCCSEMRWLFISSTTIWVTGSVAPRARRQLTSSKCE